MYLPDSNVLLTRFLSPEGVGEVVDFMPIQDVRRGKKAHQIVRVVRAVRGAVRFRLECQPAFDYARRPHQITMEGRGAVFRSEEHTSELQSLRHLVCRLLLETKKK